MFIDVLVDCAGLHGHEPPRRVGFADPCQVFGAAENRDAVVAADAVRLDVVLFGPRQDDP